MAYRYYSTLRPLMVGGIPFPKQPGESITTIVNFEEGRTYCKGIDRPAWGYIEYTAPLDPQQVSDYELVLAPEEAKLALLKARKLMAEHKLTERDLEERNTTVIKRAIGETFSKKANSWMDPLSIIIGENYCCSAFRCKISAKTTVWHVGFIGLEGDFEICVKIFRYAVRCVKSEQKKLRKQHRDYYTPQEIAKICDSYGYGFARGVYEAFTRQNEENQEYGLVLKVPKEVKDELEKIGPPKEFKKTPQPKTVGELDAVWRGVEDGRKFDPSNKLKEKKQEA